MEDEINTPAEAETETVETQETDTAEDWDYYDPEEDTVEDQEPEATDDGEETAEEADEVEGEEPEAELVDIGNGETVPMEELRSGYLRQKDYTQKAQVLATARTSLKADVERIESITQAVIDHLSELVPASPDAALAMRDPNAYIRQRAAHEEAMSRVQKLIETGQAPKEMKASMSQSDMSAVKAEQNRLLAERFPTTSTPAGKDKFMANIALAAEELGFAADDLSKVVDHRVFTLAHYAKIGMDALKSREAAKAKVAAAPPMTPRKPGQPLGGKESSAAFDRLKRTGSIHDAAKIDWV